ncbi:MAG TPA: FecR domain-containing protein [Puia sp.]|nr:FecR domain-containing protein [Puia sp.]
MREDQTRLLYLYERYCTDEATPEEAAEFWQLFHESAEDDPVMISIFSQYDTPLPAGTAAPVNWQKALDRILSQSQNESSEDEPSQDTPSQDRTPRVRPLRWWPAAAAVIILSIGITWWYRQHTATNSATIAHTPVTDLPPGHNGAILTLAQGQQVVLDSLANGDVATQGNTHIIKTNGLLAYQSSAGTDAGTGPGVKGGASSVTYNTLTVPRGRQFQLVLPDSTRVWLNAASSIRYPTTFSGSYRDVVLTGEAYFEVTRNSAQPFRVSIDSQRIEVLGTSFNISGYKEDGPIHTTLIQGSVQVNAPDHVPQKILPGDQAIAGTDGKWTVKKVNTANVIAWKEGWFRFEGNTVPVIMRQLSRWYDVDVIYKGSTPTTLRIGGEIPRDMQLSKAIDVLRLSGVNLSLENGSIIVH